MSIPDEMLKKVFVESQNKLQEYSRQLSHVRAQQQAKQRDVRLNELTQKELKQLGSDVKTYKGLGKAFLQVDLSSLNQELDLKISDANSEIKALERAGAKLERDLTEGQNVLRDLLERR
ncbi:hypothetical protein HK098_000808 [Nowakowskiella sp. JEL0407]|nr:hypothetical protein HK098_000808 [Nowakowskiella sp. JEL0407]